jgi:hypothetical protein
MKFLLASIDRVQKNLALVCLVATLLVSLAAAAHVHVTASDDGNVAGHCLLCVVAHVPGLATIAVSPTPQLPCVVALVTTGEVDHRSRLAVTDLFIRPPPSLS